MDFNKKLFRRLVDHATVYSDGRGFTFSNGVEVGRRFKAGSGWDIGFLLDVSSAFSVRGNKMLLYMEICEELRYNFDADSIWRVKIMQKKIYDVRFIEVVI